MSFIFFVCLLNVKTKEEEHEGFQETRVCGSVA